MAVLADAISVIMRRLAVDESLPGGLDTILTLAVDTGACWDDHLVQLHSRTRETAAHCVHRLQQHGLIFQTGNECMDMAVVDQHRGPTVPAPWLHRFTTTDGFTFVALAGTEPGPAFVPPGWSPDVAPLRRLPDPLTDICGIVIDGADDYGRPQRIYVCDWAQGVTRSWPADDVRQERPQVPIAEARLALIEYLKDAPQASLQHLGDDLRAGRLTTYSLPLAVRWGLHYAGVTRHPSER